MNNPAPSPDFLHMTAGKIGEALLSGLVQEIRILPDAWQKLTEEKQSDVIDRLRSRVDAAVTLAVHMIASAERVTVVGKLEQITTKNKIKAAFVISGSAEGRHDLSDAVGEDCLIVIAGAGQHLGNLGAVKADPDQNPLDLNGGDGSMEDADWSGNGNVVDGEYTDIPLLGVKRYGAFTYGHIATGVVRYGQDFDFSYLQSRFAVSTEECQELILLMLDEQIIELAAEGKDPSSNLYRVIKKLGDLDINME